MPLVHDDVVRVDLIVVENYELSVRSANLLTISQDGVILAPLNCLRKSFDIWLDSICLDPITTTGYSSQASEQDMDDLQMQFLADIFSVSVDDPRMVSREDAFPLGLDTFDAALRQRPVPTRLAELLTQARVHSFGRQRSVSTLAANSLTLSPIPLFFKNRAKKQLSKTKQTMQRCKAKNIEVLPLAIQDTEPQVLKLSFHKAPEPLGIACTPPSRRSSTLPRSLVAIAFRVFDRLANFWSLRPSPKELHALLIHGFGFRRSHSDSGVFSLSHS